MLLKPWTKRKDIGKIVQEWTFPSKDIARVVEQWTKKK